MFAEIPGPAPTQGSHSAFVSRTGRVAVVHSSKALQPWRAVAVTVMKREAPPFPLDGPIEVEIEVAVARPKGHYRGGKPGKDRLKPDAPTVPCTGRDLDKVARAVLDCATMAGWWFNDARVSSLLVRRSFVDAWEVETVRILARPDVRSLTHS